MSADPCECGSSTCKECRARYLRERLSDAQHAALEEIRKSPGRSADWYRASQQTIDSLIARATIVQDKGSLHLATDARRAGHSPGCACKPCIAFRQRLGMLGGEPVALTSMDTVQIILDADRNMAQYAPLSGEAMSKTVITTHIEAAQHARLHLISSNTGKSIGAIIREAIDQWLSRRDRGHRTTLQKGRGK